MEESNPVSTVLDVKGGSAHPIGVLWHPDLLCTLNASGYLERSNPAWINVLGWTEAELASAPIWDFIYPEDIARTQEETAVTDA